MPEGLVNILSGRHEFLDLTRYLLEIAALFTMSVGFDFPRPLPQVTVDSGGML